MTTIRRPHWSYSQLAQFLRCPLQYYFERIARLPRIVVPSSLALGAAVHEALADYHRQLLARQVPATDVVRSAFLKAWQGRLDGEVLRFQAGETAPMLCDLGVALIERYLLEPPHERIVAVEQRLVVPIEHPRRGFLRKPLVAVLDLVVQTSDGVEIQEFKTSGRRYAESSAETCWQAVCYRQAYRVGVGEAARFRYRVLLKQRVPELQSVDVPAGDDEGRRLAQMFTSIERAIARRAFFPIESPQNCSGCPYRVSCRDWQAGRSSTHAHQVAAC